MKVSSIHNAYLERIDPIIEDLALNHNQILIGLRRAKLHLERLYQWFQKNEPLDKACQVRFFKDFKSEPLAHLIYFMEVRDYFARLPIIGQKAKQRYLAGKKDTVNRFFYENHQMITYLENQETFLDHHFFVRKVNPDEGPCNLLFLDTNFSTSHDSIYAKCKAMKLFASFLINQGNTDTTNNSKRVSSNLKWTGRKVDLIELIYALHATGTFNNGNASIKMIAECFQKEFGCRLGDFYRVYTELRYRKKTRTKFLKQLSEMLVQKMEFEEG